MWVTEGNNSLDSDEDYREEKRKEKCPKILMPKKKGLNGLKISLKNWNLMFRNFHYDGPLIKNKDVP